MMLGQNLLAMLLRAGTSRLAGDLQKDSSDLKAGCAIQVHCMKAQQQYSLQSDSRTEPGTRHTAACAKTEAGCVGPLELFDSG